MSPPKIQVWRYGVDRCTSPYAEQVGFFNWLEPDFCIALMLGEEHGNVIFLAKRKLPFSLKQGLAHVHGNFLSGEMS